MGTIRSQPTDLLEAHVPAVADDDVVEDLDPKQRASSGQT